MHIPRGRCSAAFVRRLARLRPKPSRSGPTRSSARPSYSASGGCCRLSIPHGPISELSQQSLPAFEGAVLRDRRDRDHDGLVLALKKTELTDQVAPVHFWAPSALEGRA